MAEAFTVVAVFAVVVAISVAATSAEAILAGGVEAVMAGVAVTGGEAVTAGIVVTVGVVVGTVAAGMEVVHTGTETLIGGGIIRTVTKTNNRWGLAGYVGHVAANT